MEQDIRDLFKTDDFSKKKLPKAHRSEFLDKLKATKVKNKNRVSKYKLLKIAAIVLVLVSVGYFSITPFGITSGTTEETALQLQIKTVEAQYLKHIEREWGNFLQITNDDTLVTRYKQKLKSLDDDYKDISEQFQENANDIVIVEALVENLKRRLQLLKDIQEHIKILNQENDSYEKNDI